MMRIYINPLTRSVFASTQTRMETTFDPAKDEANIAKHGLSLVAFAGFDVEPIVREDTRFDYGETRFQALGMIGGVPHVIVFTLPGDVMRLVSFRRAHAKEVRQYERRRTAP